MATIENETRTREGTCPQHGQVHAVKEVPKIQFPFLITAPARGFAALRPYRCPACGAKVS
jgi:hypothetical protein